MGDKIIIIDYGMGNLNSVKKKFDRLKVNVIITSDPHEIESANKIVLPGVGHFKKAMENLNNLNLIPALNKFTLIDKKPILGICLGMQLMANNSEEGNCEGLGWIDANVVNFSISNKLRYKVPHMGWNQVHINKESLLMKEIGSQSEFYFVHSYHFIANQKSDILNETDFEYKFTSAVEKDNIYGVQYHPEKSHETGEQLLKNFINL
ncbi:imidazole glycerol phosphate synthase subunit HisH [Flexithrix dorotheae]|uniref:imidazole glycerol phosphate synthase subunit HisH n=1 Tax=Flexithrix dorotheae TaxID=70993 RepID=UPI00036C11EF|nr:imidazole glycerol phosphate synthase subunit HisH [Flexithrix dorotheae]